jgi:hypothetical protein
MTKEEVKEILQMEVDWDWEKFRRETAKDILAGIIANSFTEDMWTYQQMAEMAVEQADELIKQLKDNEKL